MTNMNPFKCWWFNNSFLLLCNKKENKIKYKRIDITKKKLLEKLVKIGFYETVQYFKVINRN